VIGQKLYREEDRSLFKWKQDGLLLLLLAGTNLEDSPWIPQRFRGLEEASSVF